MNSSYRNDLNQQSFDYNHIQASPDTGAAGTVGSDRKRTKSKKKKKRGSSVKAKMQDSMELADSEENFNIDDEVNSTDARSSAKKRSGEIGVIRES